MSNAKTCKKYADSLEAKGLTRINIIVPIDKVQDYKTLAAFDRAAAKEQGK